MTGDDEFSQFVANMNGSGYNSMKALKKKLEEVVEAEDYEDAAIIRDMIRFNAERVPEIESRERL